MLKAPKSHRLKRQRGRMHAASLSTWWVDVGAPRSRRSAQQTAPPPPGWAWRVTRRKPRWTAK
eukprot:2346590-Prymnesium_polylepis.1